MSLIKKKVLITGASGFIGFHLVNYFYKKGYEIFATYRNNKPHLIINDVKLLKLDLPDVSILDFKYDYLIHCGADTSATTNDERRFVLSNVNGSESLFQNALKNNVKAIINLSSMSVYGDINVGLVKEGYKPFNPDKYGQSKLQAEQILRNLTNENKSTRSISIRLPGVVGKNSHNNFLSRLVTDIINDKEIVIKNPDPSALFNNIIYVNDLARYINFYINSDIKGNESINIASSDPIPLLHVTELILKYVERESRIRFLKKGKKSFLISVENIKKQGFHLRSTQEMLESFIKDLIKD